MEGEESSPSKGFMSDDEEEDVVSMSPKGVDMICMEGGDDAFIVSVVVSFGLILVIHCRTISAC